MDMQLDLFGGPPGVSAESLASPNDRRFEHRYYFAVLPPPRLAQEIERLARVLSRRHGALYPTRAPRLHVSIHGVHRGKTIEPALLEEALEAGDAIRRPRFRLAFDTMSTFGKTGLTVGGRRQLPTVLTCSGGAPDAVALFGDLRREMQRRGLNVGPRAFVPHLTIWYGPETVPQREFRRSFGWLVDKVFLVHTAPGLPRPESLGEWALGG